ncbi:response regulator [Sphingomonas sp. AOB5]|uniref:response regulator transcription factor n=1 Tax=Sphingomonas sp. AOB5 TaxID=3034017 RepID=UPI0023F78BFA|nr:response regulator [Sphingomonas sp. AOB5]MDF7776425.1 response regulator [Sphingomonas sp. AOB5]
MPLTAPMIAIVEDDESLRPALVGFVRSLGYIGEGFASAEAFLDGDAQSRAACLVSDYQLPGMNGLDLSARMQGTLPVILVTARTERSIDERAEAAGVRCLLRKPFETDALADCIRRALDS